MNGSLLFTPLIYLWIRVPIKEIQSNIQQDFLCILESLGIIHVSHLDFIWPNCCFSSHQSKSSFRKMRKKVNNKKWEKNYAVTTCVQCKGRGWLQLFTHPFFPAMTLADLSSPFFCGIFFGGRGRMWHVGRCLCVFCFVFLFLFW